MMVRRRVRVLALISRYAGATLVAIAIMVAGRLSGCMNKRVRFSAGNTMALLRRGKAFPELVSEVASPGPDANAHRAPAITTVRILLL